MFLERMGCSFSKKLRKKRNGSEDQGRNGSVIGQANQAHEEYEEVAQPSTNQIEESSGMLPDQPSTATTTTSRSSYQANSSTSASGAVIAEEASIVSATSKSSLGSDSYAKSVIQLKAMNDLLAKQYDTFQEHFATPYSESHAGKANLYPSASQVEFFRMLDEKIEKGAGDAGEIIH